VIAYLKGVVAALERESVILETGGVGYEVFVAPHTLHRLAEGGPAELFVSESSALYGGTTTLYGFVSREEKEIFLSLKEHVPGTGAKKALEFLDKASRSLPDFRRAILDGDARMLCDVFGFTKKTAEKLIAGLKDKLGKAHAAGTIHVSPASAPSSASGQALNALLALGYKPAEARQALETVGRENAAKEASVEELIRLALKQL
jgi:Holliday junction DNA helicase RuvA